MSVFNYLLVVIYSSNIVYLSQLNDHRTNVKATYIFTITH